MTPHDLSGPKPAGSRPESPCWGSLTVHGGEVVTCYGHIEDGVSTKAALKNKVWAVAEPNQYPGDTHETLNDYL